LKKEKTVTLRGQSHIDFVFLASFIRLLGGWVSFKDANKTIII